MSVVRAQRGATGAEITRVSRCCLLCALTFLGTESLAAPGDILFRDRLNGNLIQWTIASSGGDASMGSETRVQGRALRLRWGTVSVTSDAFDGAVPAVQFDLWVRRGDDSFSEDPDQNEDLVIEYLNASAVWATLEVFAGDGAPGEIYQPSYVLPNDALHAGLQVRLRTTGGDGEDEDYWHVDEILITEIVPVVSASFVLNHDSFGIHCLAETVTVDVVDAAAGTPLLGYDATVQLDTQSGNGTWTLVAGSGSFNDATADDGIATYDWPLGESQAVFQLEYSQGAPSIDIDVFQVSDPGIRDTDAEGNLVFSPNGFTLTAAALSNPPPALIVPFDAAQTAAAPFDVYLTAYGQTANDPVCGVIESYAGAKSLKFWSTYADPGTGTIPVTINGGGIATVEGSAGAQAVAFVNGQASVIAKYKDVGRMQVLVKDDTVGDPDLPNGIRGATAGFVVKPDRFLLSNIQDASGTPNPGAADASGPAFVAAGASFSATVAAIDAEGDVTPNYGQESVAETVRLSATVVSPAAGNNPAVSAAVGFGAFAAGQATGTDFTWAEVGIVTLTPSVGDGSYFDAGDVAGLVSGNVGRFTPSYFAVSLNAPRFSTACAAGSYTYLGEAFDYAIAPVITVTAQAAGGITTQNYRGGFFKLDNASLANRAYSAATGTLDASGVPAPAADPVIVDLGGGSGSLTFDAGSGLLFGRTTPQAPFDADIELSIDVIDSDGVVALANPVTFGDPGGIAFDNGPNMRYGRIRLANALGSELVNLGLPARAEYYVDAATGFVTHSDDACTGDVSLSLGAFTLNLEDGDTCVMDGGSPGDSGAGCAAPGPPGQRYREPPLGGDFNLILAAPGAGDDGSATATADVPGWLRFDWDPATPGLENPSGTARFGIFSGEGQRIYTRELY